MDIETEPLGDAADPVGDASRSGIRYLGRGVAIPTNAVVERPVAAHHVGCIQPRHYAEHLLDGLSGHGGIAPPRRLPQPPREAHLIE